MLLSARFLSSLLTATFLVKLIVVQCQEQSSTQKQPEDTSKAQSATTISDRLLVLTLVENPSSESFQRFNQSIASYDLSLTIVNFNPTTTTKQEQEGGAENKDDEHFALARRKFESMRKAIANYKSEQDLLIMLVDSTNLIVNGDKKTILSKFMSTKSKLLFSADSICWPDVELARNYPATMIDEETSNVTSAIGQRFLDSRALIGYAPKMWEFFNQLTTAKGGESSIEAQLLQAFTRYHKSAEYHPASSGDKKSQPQFNMRNREGGDFFLQLYSTLVYLNEETRRQIGISLDHRSKLFENLHSTKNDVELEFDLDGVNVKNLAYKTNPVVIHGSGSSKIVLNSLGNYLGRAWTQNEGCRHCNQTMISLANLKESDLPTVLIGVFIEEPTPFLDYFFEHLLALDYPKRRLHLFLHNQIEYHAQEVAKFFQQLESLDFASKQLVDWNGQSNDWQAGTARPLSEWEARSMALNKCERLNCDYYLSLDSVVHLESNQTLRLLIETNRTIVAPALSRPRKLWSNFWGAITPEGYYSRSHDYVELVGRERLGVWNVPHIMNAYLIEGRFLRSTLELEREGADSLQAANEISDQQLTQTTQTKTLAYFDANFPTVKPVLIFSRNLRHANIYQFVNNLHDFGHLVDPTSFNLSRTNPEFYQLENNMIEWERRYLHENYSKLLDDEETPHLESPCQDVYWFPVVNEQFTKQLIEIMETFGTWSSGTSDDPRIEGGYESVPTRDIHFKQVGLHEMWLFFLREYIMPVQLKEYIGYEHDPPRTDLAFVVRYHPAEQASLRPHHDSSTYTLNIALNEPGVDYQGGGCRFVRYNCSVVDSRRGWALIHPGRLTHYHEGLPVTSGTRYILVTFVDP